MLLPTIGMASMLWAAGRSGPGVIWRWGRPTPRGGDGGRGRLARRCIIQDERTGTRSRSR